MIALCYKDGKKVNHYSFITKIKVDKKYNYYEFHQMIFHHEIIFVRRFNEIDYIELYENMGDKNPIKVVRAHETSNNFNL